MSTNRRQFRYSVDLESAELTPLASVEAHLGEEPLRVLNISMGGLAILFERQQSLAVGEIIELSLELRQRAFPVTVEIKACRGLRYSCQFVEVSPACETALEVFMAPKSIGESLQINEKLTNNPEALRLVEGAESYLAYVGKEGSVAFVWLGKTFVVQKLLISSKGKVFEWTQGTGLRTGEFDKLNAEEPRYHEVPDEMLRQYFVDVITSWLKGDRALEFTKGLLRPERQNLVFPRPGNQL